MHFTQACLYFLDNLKMYHWNTHSFARHKASDECFATTQKLVDQFVETYIGKYGRQSILKPCHHNVNVLDDNQAVKLFQWFISFIEELQFSLSDSELLNIRDEMLGQLQQCMYLFTLDSAYSTPSRRSAKRKSYKLKSSKKSSRK